MKIMKYVRTPLMITIGGSLIIGFLEWLSGADTRRIIRDRLSMAPGLFLMGILIAKYTTEPLTERAIMVLAGVLLLTLFALVFVTNYPFP